MNSRENIFLWIIVAAPLGIYLGFVSAPPDVISQVLGAFVGAVLFTAGVCVIFWIIKKLHRDHSEKKS